MGKPERKRHADYMTLALEEACAAELAGDVPVGAVMVCEGQVIATGRNTREAENDPLGHAEMNAIREAAKALGRWRLTGCTLYVTLEPCPMCAAALVAARVPLLVFGASDPKAGAAGSRFNLVADVRLNHQVQVIAGVSETVCEAKLRRFFREESKL